MNDSYNLEFLIGFFNSVSVLYISINFTNLYATIHLNTNLGDFINGSIN